MISFQKSAAKGFLIGGVLITAYNKTQNQLTGHATFTADLCEPWCVLVTRQDA